MDDLLRQISLFAGLEADEIRCLIQSARPIELPAGAFLFREGERGDCFFVILAGEVEIIQALGTPEERLLLVLRAGDFLGEMSLFEPEGLRAASGRVRTSLRALAVTHADFDALLRQSPHLAYELARELTRRLRKDDAAAIRDLQEKNRQLAKAYAALQIAQAQLVEKEKLERELQVARRIQQSMLPSVLPQMPGYTFAAHLLPARSVSGDLYDFIPLDTDTLGVVIGDVSDKGVPAALFMALVRALLRAEAQKDYTPAQVLRGVNRHLLDMNEAGMFVTLLYGILHGPSGRFTYARAGHELPLLFDGQGHALPVAHTVGQILGLFDDVLLDEQTLTIPPGGVLLLTTDGAADVENPAGERFGRQRLEMAAHPGPGESAPAVCDRLLGTIQAYQANAAQADDVTLVAVQSQPTSFQEC